jgi:hypothetical protein
MYNLLLRLFRFLLPIVRQAAVQTAADELSKHAYGGRPQRPRVPYNQMGYARYDRNHPRPARPTFDANTGKAMPPAETIGETHEGRGFHDVLRVAFDISGPNAKNTHEWLMANLPTPGEAGDAGEIYLDSWHVANDERFDRSDCDSAVFVAMGNQNEARQVLREAGLTTPGVEY